MATKESSIDNIEISSDEDRTATLQDILAQQKSELTNVKLEIEIEKTKQEIKVQKALLQDMKDKKVGQDYGLSDLSDSCWSKVLETSSSGTELYGRKVDLIDAVKHGAEVRFYVSTWENGSSTQNVTYKDGEVYAQSLMHVSKGGWDCFQSDLYWWFLNISTTGLVHMSRWLVGSHSKVSDSRKTAQISWFVRLPNNGISGSLDPVFSNTAEGSVSSGNVLYLKKAIEKGADLRVVSKRNPDNGYMTPFTNIASTEGVVSGQAVWHVSQTPVGNHIEFQNDAYWWFTMWSSDGTRDMSRWDVGAHKDRGHTNDKVAADWFVDTCWSFAYKHDPEGNEIVGSLDYLRSAALNGHRVKLVMDSYSIEADNLQIKDDQLNAQLLGHVSKNGIQRFQDNVYWYWHNISTSGLSNTVRYNVGGTKNRGNTDSKIAVSWFIDNRTWTHVLSTSPSGSVTFGSKTKLIDAVKAGSVIRYTVSLPDEVLMLSADNVSTSNDGCDVAAQTIRLISYTTEGVRMFQSNPYWLFTIATTTGQLKWSKWTVGQHEHVGNETENVAINWFID